MTLVVIKESVASCVNKHLLFACFSSQKNRESTMTHSCDVTDHAWYSVSATKYSCDVTDRSWYSVGATQHSCDVTDHAWYSVSATK